MRILKIESCLTLSSKSTLTYHIGHENDKIHFRVHANTGGGYFSQEWVALKDIQAVLTGTFSSIPLHPLFRGKSVNTPAFLLAVLTHEKLLLPVKPRSYKWADLKVFMARVEKLIASDINLDPEKAPAKKTPRKTPKTNTGS
jgi:hypothetical protein